MTRLEVFAALAETRESLGAAFLATHGPVWDNFARNLVVWAAPTGTPARARTEGCALSI